MSFIGQVFSVQCSLRTIMLINTFDLFSVDVCPCPQSTYSKARGLHGSAAHSTGPREAGVCVLAGTKLLVILLNLI